MGEGRLTVFVCPDCGGSATSPWRLFHTLKCSEGAEPIQLLPASIAERLAETARSIVADAIAKGKRTAGEGFTFEEGRIDAARTLLADYDKAMGR